MSEMTFEDAKAALSDAANSPEPSSGIAPPATSEPAPSSPEVGPQGTTEPSSDSFTRSDLGSLLEGVSDPAARQAIETAYKSFQGDYTRKTQELSQQYGGIDPDRARQSVEFINALETDPNFVMSVHTQLTEALTAAGYTPAEAKAAAAEAINDTTGTQGDPSLGEYEDPETARLAKEIDELRSWKEQQEHQQYEMNLAAQLQRQEMGIRASDPTLREAEIDRIYELAFAHGGDLTKAHQAYSAWKTDVLGEYVTAKSEVPQIGVPDSTGHSETPRPTSWTFDEGHEMAKQHLAEILANS